MATNQPTQSLLSLSPIKTCVQLDMMKRMLKWNGIFLLSVSNVSPLPFEQTVEMKDKKTYQDFNQAVDAPLENRIDQQNVKKPQDLLLRMMD